jgi:hypothetical protein
LAYQKYAEVGFIGVLYSGKISFFKQKIILTFRKIRYYQKWQKRRVHAPPWYKKSLPLMTAGFVRMTNRKGEKKPFAVIIRSMLYLCGIYFYYSLFVFNDKL